MTKRFVVERRESVDYEVIDNTTNSMVEKFVASSYSNDLSKKEARRMAYALVRKLELNQKIKKQDMNSVNWKEQLPHSQEQTKK